jgi:hypothetical protein
MEDIEVTDTIRDVVDMTDIPDEAVFTGDLDQVIARIRELGVVR